MYNYCHCYNYNNNKHYYYSCCCQWCYIQSTAQWFYIAAAASFGSFSMDSDLAEAIRVMHVISASCGQGL